MKLIDFKQDQALDKLRSDMGTDSYGLFELFDPNRHLSWQERQGLHTGWQSIQSSSLRTQSDKTLGYKNTHVFCQHEETAHFAFCDQLKKHMQQGKLPRVNITLNDTILKNEQVCHYCLHAISYQGFDVYRHRHQEYNQKIIKNFNLNQYITQKYK
ncbi:MAG: hypothetical protein ACJA0E_001299 [Bermanella sp.]|jgi:hypothetical protein